MKDAGLRGVSLQLIIISTIVAVVVIIERQRQRRSVKFLPGSPIDRSSLTRRNLVHVGIFSLRVHSYDCDLPECYSCSENYRYRKLSLKYNRAKVYAKKKQKSVKHLCVQGTQTEPKLPWSSLNLIRVIPLTQYLLPGL